MANSIYIIKKEQNKITVSDVLAQIKANNIKTSIKFQNQSIEQVLLAQNQSIANIANKTVVENNKLYLVKPDGTKLDDGTELPTGGSSEADGITIKDTDNNFTATNVEGALSELFQSASSGKELIANAITGKGIETSADDTFQTMATNISNIQGLKNDVVEFSQMNDLVTSYLASAESQYTNDNGDTVSVISNYGTSDGHKDRPLGYSISNKNGTVYFQNEETGQGSVLQNPIGSTHEIYNAIPNKISQYLLKDSNNNVIENGRIKPTGKIRMLRFYGYINNCRDLGGWSCDGGIVKYGLLYRSAVISSVESIDKQIAKNIGFKHQIDLRESEESDNMTESPLGSSVRYERFPFSLYYKDAIDSEQSNYENAKKLFKHIFDCVIHQEPLVYHCSLGRDRTGTVTFMLLALLGVSRKDIDIDYELSAFSTIGSNAPRTLSDYREMATYLSTLGGSTLIDNVVWWFIKAGFMIDELNAFRNAMIDGTPTPLNANDYITTYKVTNNLTGCTTSNDVISVYEGNSYSTILTMTGNNNTWKSIVVTMGRVDITSSVYSNGTISIENVTGDIVITAVAEYIAPYTNQIKKSINSDGTIYNAGQGWKTGYKLNAGTGAEEEKSGYEVTGFIPVTYTDTIRIKNFISENGVGYNMMLFFDSSFAVVGAFTANSSYNPLSQFVKSDGSIEACISNATTTNFTEAKKTSIAYMRLSFKEINNTTICTINEEIV